MYNGRRGRTRTYGVSMSRIYSPLPSPLGYSPIEWGDKAKLYHPKECFKMRTTLESYWLRSPQNNWFECHYTPQSECGLLKSL